MKWYKRHWSNPETKMTTLQVSTRLTVMNDSLSTRKRGMRTASEGKATAEKGETEAYFTFDPNILSDSGWLSLGLSERQVEVIRNYQDAGGYFQKPHDVSKLYTLPKGWFERHRKDIRITTAAIEEQNSTVGSGKFKHPISSFKHEPREEKESDVRVELVELNDATAEGLVAIRGVGSASAVRILRFREALGGFIDTTQLHEVWGLHPEVRKKLLAAIKIDPALIHKIDLDTASVKTLASHPYINWDVARSLVRYRQQHGRFKKVDDIRLSYLVSDSLAEKIKPYLYASGDH